jgi:integrase
MPRPDKTTYLKVRNGNYSVFLDVPKALRPAIGVARLTKSLRTTDRNIAERRKAPLLALWFERLEQARLSNDPTADAATRARAFYEEASKGPWTYTQEFKDGSSVVHELDPEREAKEHLLNVIDDTPDADQVFSYAIGNLHRIADEIPEYLSFKPLHDRTKEQKIAVLRIFTEVTGVVYVEDITRPNLRIWIASQSHLARSTVGVYMAHLSDFWKHCAAKYDWEQRAPFDRLLPPASTKKTKTSYTDEQLVQLLTAAEPVLRSLILIGCHSGMRIEEICSLKPEHIRNGVFTVLEGKTDAAARLVPIHNRIQPIVDRIAGPTWLYEGLQMDRFGDRSPVYQRNFSRLKKSLGFTRAYDFHSTRRSLITCLERAGVPELEAGRSVGHKVKTITYGLYSSGSTVEKLRPIINRAHYDIPQHLFE